MRQSSVMDPRRSHHSHGTPEVNTTVVRVLVELLTPSKARPCPHLTNCFWSLTVLLLWVLTREDVEMKVSLLRTQQPLPRTSC